MTFQRVLYNKMGEVTLTRPATPQAMTAPPWPGRRPT